MKNREASKRVPKAANGAEGVAGAHTAAPAPTRVLAIEAIDVVIPARDEESLLGDAIEAVLASRRALLEASRRQTARRRVPLGCRVVVVLDACIDRSLDVARSFGSQIDIVRVDFAAVGRARSAGVDHALTRFDRPRAQWICCTDADTLVQRGWLADHLAVAESGALVAVGRVSPNPPDLTPEALAAWHRAHTTPATSTTVTSTVPTSHTPSRPTPSRPAPERHVFGANLGIRADAYLLAGGFGPYRVGEDVSLVRAIDALDDAQLATLGSSGARAVVELSTSVATTSGRLDGRTPGGFAGYLRTLVD